MAEVVLRTRDLRKRFGNVVALDNVSLAVERGEIFGFDMCRRTRQTPGRRTERSRLTDTKFLLSADQERRASGTNSMKPAVRPGCEETSGQPARALKEPPVGAGQHANAGTGRPVMGSDGSVDPAGDLGRWCG